MDDTELNKRTRRFFFDDDGYWTAWTTTTTTLASQWGLLINIDSATGDIARTTDWWIEDERYGMYYDSIAWTSSGEFDSAVTRTGRLTLKLSTTNAAWSTGINSYWVYGAWAFGIQKYLFPCKPSTKYRLRCFVKTTNAATNSVFIQFREFTAGIVAWTATPSNTLTWTNDWTLCTVTVTTGASSVYMGYNLLNFVAWNVSDAWFDINSMTLEEVIEPVANSLVTPSPSLVSFTAVGSTDNIDQSFLTTPSSTSAVWNAWGLQYMKSQSFTPTKSKLTWVYLYKRANVGSPTGNMKIDIRTDNAGSPSSTILATYTIPLATYNAITDDTEFIVNLPCNVTAGTLYHIVATNTATEALNAYFVLWKVNAGWYTWWAAKLSSDWGAVWSLDGTADLYFKTLYYKPTTNFKASQNNLSVSVSADEDGFIEWSVLNVTTWAWSFNDTVNDGSINNNMYFYRTPWVTFDSNLVKFSGAAQEYRLKINLWLVATTDLIYTIGFIANNTISYSFDDISYTPLWTLVWAGWNFSIPMTGQTIVYIKNYANAAWSMTAHSASCSVNTSSINWKLKNYPTNKDIIKQYSTTLWAPTTSATYRATKWGFPAIEYLPLWVSTTSLSARYDMLGNANDTSGNWYNGTVNWPTLTTGRFWDSNSAYAFSGTNQYITLPQNAMPLTFPLTISVWAKPNVIQVWANDVILMVWNAVPNQWYWIAFWWTTWASINKIFWFGFWLSNTDANAIYTVWNTYHIVFTIDAWKVSQLFINWVKQTSTNTYTTLVPAGTWCEVWRLYVNDTRALDWTVYWLASWNRVLSDAEILAMYTQWQEEQYLDVDTTATGSTVAFSELWTTYTTVADGASLAISSTSTPNLFVKANITANRLYSSSNDYNASSDKDGSMRETVVYQVVQ